MSILVYGRDVFCHLCYLPYTSTTWQTILKTLTLFFRLVMRKYVVCYNNNADDIVLLAETANDLQVLLDVLHDWCCTNDMNINSMKSYIVHFRPLSVPVTDVIFMCGDANLSIVNKYTYLGIVLTEHLDYNVSAKCVAESASRALGLLIAKCKVAGGVPYNVFY